MPKKSKFELTLEVKLAGLKNIREEIIHEMNDQQKKLDGVNVQIDMLTDILGGADHISTPVDMGGITATMPKSTEGAD